MHFAHIKAFTALTSVKKIAQKKIKNIYGIKNVVFGAADMKYFTCEF